jgi:alpha-tubulin suppressor-like RCC1 family protein
LFLQHLFVSGQLGLGKECEDLRILGHVSSLQGVKVLKVASGGNHNLAVTAEGQVLSWGAGRNGRLGTGSDETLYTPSPIEIRLPPATICRISDIACG